MRDDATRPAERVKAQKNPVRGMTKPKRKAPRPVPASKATFQRVLPMACSFFETLFMVRIRVAFWSSPNPVPKSAAPTSRARPPEGRQIMPTVQVSRPGMSSRCGSRRSPKRPAHHRATVVVEPKIKSPPTAENSPDPGAANGKNVSTTPAAMVVAVNISEIRRRGPRLRATKIPEPDSTKSCADDAERRMTGIAASPGSGTRPPAKKTRLDPYWSTSHSPRGLQKMFGTVMAMPSSPSA